LSENEDASLTFLFLSHFFIMFASSLSLGLVFFPFALATVIDVTVGANKTLQYTPENITAKVGDIITFTFQPKNHTVTQSTFANPCDKMDAGFSSGFQPVSANVTDNFPTFNITINDTKPIWVYCGQAAGTPASHCGNGMVMAINAPNNSFAEFQQAALAVGISLSSAAAASTQTAATGASTQVAATATSTQTAVTSDSSSTSSALSPTSTSSSASITRVGKVGSSGILLISVLLLVCIS